MKFSILRSKFLEGLKSVQNIVAGKGSLPIIQNVMIEAKGNEIKLTTTDLDISIRSTVGCDVKEEGASTLPVKILFNLMVKAPEGEVEVTIDPNEQAVIRAGSASYKLNGKVQRLDGADRAVLGLLHPERTVGEEHHKVRLVGADAGALAVGERGHTVAVHEPAAQLPHERMASLAAAPHADLG